MNIAYWIIAGLLALAYLAVGGMKIFRSQEQLLSSGMGWVEGMPAGVVKLIGALEILGAIGLIVPPLVHIAPGLAIAAAIGLILLQIVAMIVHIRRKEFRNLPANAVLLVLAVVAAILAPSVM